MQSVAAFLAVAAAVICTPGQDTALTIRNTLAGGRAAGFGTALGVAAGQACWTLAAAAGATAVLLASEAAFTAVKLAGAAYLVVLGVQTLRHAGRPPRAAARGTARAPFRQGLLSNLGNPKMAAFFGSLLPQFTPATGPAFPVLLGLGLAFCALTLLWLSLYAVAVTRLRGGLERPRVRRALDAVTGVALVALGVRLALVRRD